MRGTNQQTGKALSGVEHLRQSIQDILSCPLGSRVMLRDYGSRLFELVDAPLNRSTLIELYVATIDALQKWEPRLAIARVFASAVSDGRVTLELEGVYLPTGQPVTVDGIVI